MDAAWRRTFFTDFDLRAFVSPGNLNATVINIYQICHIHRRQHRVAAYSNFTLLKLPARKKHTDVNNVLVQTFQFAPSVLWCCWLGLLTCKTHYRVGEPTAAWQYVDICQHRSFDNGWQYVSCGQRQPPLSGAPVNKWLSTITTERRIPPDSESGGIPHLFGTSVPPYRQCLTGSSWQQQQQQQFQFAHIAQINNWTICKLAYRPTGSTTAALVQLFHTVTELLNDHPYVVVIAFDFSRAFDTVRHVTLLQKLASLDIPDCV